MNRGPIIDRLLGVGFVKLFHMRCMILVRPNSGGISVPNMGNRGLPMLILRFKPRLAFDGRKVFYCLSFNNQTVISLIIIHKRPLNAYFNVFDTSTRRYNLAFMLAIAARCIDRERCFLTYKLLAFCLWLYLVLHFL